MLRDEERWGKWGISFEKREKQQQQIGVGFFPDPAVLLTPKPFRRDKDAPEGTSADPAPEKTWPGLER